MQFESSRPAAAITTKERKTQTNVIDFHIPCMTLTALLRQAEHALFQVISVVAGYKNAAANDALQMGFPTRDVRVLR